MRSSELIGSATVRVIIINVSNFSYINNSKFKTSASCTQQSRYVKPRLLFACANHFKFFLYDSD